VVSANKENELLKNFEPKEDDDPAVDKVTLYKEQLI
jgi:hypothetical protein